MIRAQVSDGGRVYVEVEDAGSSREGTFGEIESPHGLYLLRSPIGRVRYPPWCPRMGDPGFVLGRP